jgi:transaldolase
MERQAQKISSWGENVYVKIPVTNTKREPTGELLRRLSDDGVKVNVTALMTARQVEQVAESISDARAAYVSVFAGRVADSGRDPIPIMQESLAVLQDLRQVELIWASPRELLNIVQAHEIGCDIITVTHDLLKKLPTLGKDLDDFSLDTVQMFHSDASSAGYTL